MANKAPSFSLYMSGTPMRSDNYQSWADSIKLWFIGNGCEDHLTSTKSSVPEDKHPQW